MSRGYVPEDYRPVEALGQWVVYSIWAYVGMVVLLELSFFLMVLFFHEGVGDDPAAMAVMMFVQIIDWLEDLAWLVSGVLCFVWMHRMVLNLHALEVEGVRASPHGAWLWWFVPLANFVMPYRVLQQIGAGSSLKEGDEAGVTGIVNRLWGVDVTVFLMAFGLFFLQVFLVELLSPTPSEHMVWYQLMTLPVSVLGVVSCLLFIRIVDRFTTWQDEKAKTILGWY